MLEEEVNTSTELTDASDETTPEVTEEVEEEVAEPSEEIGEPEEEVRFMRKEDVPPELLPKWTEMDKRFTQGLQGIAQIKKDAEAYREIMAEVEQEKEAEEEGGGPSEEIPETAESSLEDLSLLSPEDQREVIKEIVRQQMSEELQPERDARLQKEVERLEADPKYAGLLEKHASKIGKIFEAIPVFKNSSDGIEAALRLVSFEDAFQQGRNDAYEEMKKKKGTQVEIESSSPSNISEVKTTSPSFQEAYRQAVKKHTK